MNAKWLTVCIVLSSSISFAGGIGSAEKIEFTRPTKEQQKAAIRSQLENFNVVSQFPCVPEPTTSVPNFGGTGSAGAGSDYRALLSEKLRLKTKAVADESAVPEIIANEAKQNLNLSQTVEIRNHGALLTHKFQKNRANQPLGFDIVKRSEIDEANIREWVMINVSILKKRFIEPKGLSTELGSIIVEPVDQNDVKTSDLVEFAEKDGALVVALRVPFSCETGEPAVVAHLPEIINNAYASFEALEAQLPAN